MSEVFATLSVARSGMGAYKLWIDAVADNVANIDNVTSTDQAAFQERFVVVRPEADPSGVAADDIGRGVVVTGVQFGNPNGRVVYEPTNPLADANGMVRRPDIDLTDRRSVGAAVRDLVASAEPVARTGR